MSSPLDVPVLNWRKPVSINAIAVFLFLLLFVGKLCYCPLYYVELSSLGLVPLLCGPRLFRWLGCGVIALGLLRAALEGNAPMEFERRAERVRAESIQQTQRP